MPKFKFKDRNILYQLPPGYRTTTPDVPVVLAFHGLYSSAKEMQNKTGLSQRAAKNGYVLVCPDGQKWGLVKGWHAGKCFTAYDDIDIDFAKALLDELRSNHIPNMGKLFFTGMSNGAMLTHRLAFQLQGYKISAIATVSGTLAIDISAGDHDYPIPFMHFHGSDDKIVLPEGGGFSKCRYKSLDDTLRIWRSRNKTKSIANETVLPDVPDGMKVTKHVYQVETPGVGAPVIFYDIENGGHSWPGHPLPRRLKWIIIGLGDTGNFTRDINAEDEIFDFFDRYL